MTALDLINRAMRAANIIGLGEDAGGSEANNALMLMNSMIELWTVEKSMPFYKLNETFNLVDGTGTYTIGSSATANFNTTRPVSITSAFVRDGTTDYPLTIITNDEYRRITSKSSESMPKYLNYVPTYDYINIEFPTVRCGQINLWPVPSSSSYDIGLSQVKQLTTYGALNTTAYLPIGYDSAIVYGLAIELCLLYNKDPSPLLMKRALEAKNILEAANQEHEVLVSDYPFGKNSSYDINVE